QRRATIGLWGELFVISEAREPAILLKGWHRDPLERFDFSGGDCAVEVKSSARRIRQHHFSVEQANPPNSMTVWVASLFVEKQTEGLSLGELWDRCRVLVENDPDLLLRIEEVCI